MSLNKGNKGVDMAMQHYYPVTVCLLNRAVFLVLLVLLVSGYSNGEGMYHSYHKTDITNEIHVCPVTVFVRRIYMHHGGV